MNLTAIAAGEPPITDFLQYVNFSGMADGLVGGVYPNLAFCANLDPNPHTRTAPMSIVGSLPGHSTDHRA